MRKLFSILLVIVLVSTCVADEQEAKYAQRINPGHALLRGFVNTLTFWLEVPRCTTLGVNKYPVFGMISGCMEGLYLGGARAALSVVDFFALGCTGPSAYRPDVFPEYVWQSQWNPYSTDISPMMIELEKDYESREDLDESASEDMERAL